MENHTAIVTVAETQQYGAVALGETRNTPIFAPRGIEFAPTEGDELLLAPLYGGYCCLGVHQMPQQLQPGEVRISSSGGGSIHITNHGDIILNGLTITKDGQIIPPK